MFLGNRRTGSMFRYNKNLAYVDYAKTQKNFAYSGQYFQEVRQAFKLIDIKQLFYEVCK